MCCSRLQTHNEFIVKNALACSQRRYNGLERNCGKLFGVIREPAMRNHTKENYYDFHSISAASVRLLFWRSQRLWSDGGWNRLYGRFRY
jgi:hypothetical protein